MRFACTCCLLLSALVVHGCDAGDPTIPPAPTVGDSTAPSITREVFVSGLSNPWDFAWLPNGELLITERPGRVRLRRTSGALITVAQPSDVVTGGEGGLLGMTVDPDFTANRYIYTCFSSRSGISTDNRVVRFTLAADGASVTERRDIVTGLPYANGERHSGCRPRFGPDGQLWIGTGDAAIGTHPQDLTSLGGKVLRVTRDGVASVGNPALPGADPRVYTVGHRNVQGLSFQPGTNIPFAIEQGPSFDDEVTRLTAGGNGGWNPVPGYNEAVPMTDRTRYPAALPALWQSGAPARGTSGGAFLSGATWKGWDGALVIGQLSGTSLIVLRLTPAGTLAGTTALFGNLGVRLRTPLQGPDGALYVSTDGTSGAGEIWRIRPQ
jgi:glucose/arabinose dehydrogenase